MNCNDIFTRHISGARGMLKRNQRQSHCDSQQKNWQNAGDQGWEKYVFMVIKSIAIEFGPASVWDWK